jgi:hypothetical protein
VFERTTQAVSWNFTVHPTEALVDESKLETQNGVATAESRMCVCAVLGASVQGGGRWYTTV